MLVFLFFSKLPIRQVTLRCIMRCSSEISKLPIRQVTKVV